MNEFPYLIFRKCCYFCANKKTCKENNGNLSDFDLCSNFVLREDLARFLSVEIFDAVVEVMNKFVRADELCSSPHPGMVGEEKGR